MQEELLVQTDTYTLSSYETPDDTLQFRYRALNEHYLTHYYPGVIDCLEEELPGIFACDCFNKTNKPFREEVARTPLPHLLEHILLEYAADRKYCADNQPVHFTAETTWDWEHEPHGTFWITIPVAGNDKEYFKAALPESVNLFNKTITSPSKADTSQ